MQQRSITSFFSRKRKKETEEEENKEEKEEDAVPQKPKKRLRKAARVIADSSSDSEEEQQQQEKPPEEEMEEEKSENFMDTETEASLKTEDQMLDDYFKEEDGEEEEETEEETETETETKTETEKKETEIDEREKEKEKQKKIKEALEKRKKKSKKKRPEEEEIQVGEEEVCFDPWKAGEPVPYLVLARTFAEIDKTTKRLEIIALLRNALRAVIDRTPEHLLCCVHLAANKLSAAYNGIELGIGESIIMKSICDATGRTMASVKTEYREKGDLGVIAAESKSTQRVMFQPKPLTLRKVFEKFVEIAKLSGHSSMNKKKGIIQGLLVSAKEMEPQYIVRSLQGKLRIGLAEKSVLTALAHAVESHKAFKEGRVCTKETLDKAAEILRGVYSELPDYEKVVPALLEVGVTEELSKRCHLTPGIPIEPMLAQPTKGLSEVLDRFKDISFSCEYKYDGERAQIHRLPNGDTFIYSRNAENNTPKFPDIIQFLPRAMLPQTESFIVDCEVVAIDKESGKLNPFQILSTRARKDVKIEDVQVPVCLFVFDLLYLNGVSLVKKPLLERRELLNSAFQVIPNEFQMAQFKNCTEVEEIQDFLDASIVAQCEGLMVKTLEHNASYEPARRSFNWLKVKKDYLEGVADSLDLVPIAGFSGKGKRTGVFGAYLLACYDDETEQYQAITKIGTGFSDQALEDLSKKLRDHIIPRAPPYYLTGDLKPDVWFDPVTVWEVKTADLSLSPAYFAAFGRVASGKGISLRFPRYIRTRDDKNPTQATNAGQVVTFYEAQATVASSSASSSTSSSSTAHGFYDDEY